MVREWNNEWQFGIFDPDVAGAGIHTLVYSYVDGNSCENSDTVLVTVNGLPYVDAGLDTNICDQLIGVGYVGNPLVDIGQVQGWIVVDYLCHLV